MSGEPARHAGSDRTDAYAPPEAFIEVTPENRDLPVSRHLTLAQFITKDQFSVWPKYVALDPRLLDKLEAAGLIRRERSLPDRRQVLCFVTPEGRRVLDGLDPKVDALDEEVTGALSGPRLSAFLDMLEDIRRANAERGAPRHTARAEP